MAAPRLLVVASTYPGHPGDGTPSFVRDLSAYEARSFDTAVLVPRVPGAAREERDGGLRVVRFPYFPRRHEDLAHGAIIENLRSRRSRWVQVPPFLVSEAVALRRLVRSFRPDVLHIHWVVPQGAVALAAARGVPWLVTTLGGDVYALNDPVSRRLKRGVLRRAGAVTTMNADMRTRLVGLGAPDDRTFVVPMGTDVEALREQATGVEPVPGRLLFAGRLVEKKGLAVLLDAVRRLPSGLAWSLDVVGDGPLRGVLEAQARDLPVTFLGRQGRAELSRSLARSQVVVVPSVTAASGDQDGLPVVLLEAMALGRPVVASRLPGIADAVVDGQTGLLVAPGDASGVADALAGLLRDPGRGLVLGAEAARRSEEHSLTARGARYVALLRELIGDGTVAHPE